MPALDTLPREKNVKDIGIVPMKAGVQFGHQSERVTVGCRHHLGLGSNSSRIGVDARKDKLAGSTTLGVRDLGASNGNLAVKKCLLDSHIDGDVLHLVMLGLTKITQSKSLRKLQLEAVWGAIALLLGFSCAHNLVLVG